MGGMQIIAGSMRSASPALVHNHYIPFADVRVRMTLHSFVYPLPDNVPEEIIAPMLCGGVSMFLHLDVGE